MATCAPILNSTHCLNPEAEESQLSKPGLVPPFLECPDMSRHDFSLAAQEPFRNPWPPLAIGLAGTLLSALWFEIVRAPAVPLVVVGLIATGGAIAIWPRSAAILGLAALSGLFAYVGLSYDERKGGMDWDSIRMLVLVLTAVAVLAAVLVCLPRIVRRVVVSLIILFHFGGMICQATSITPCPWLSLLLQTYVYRPYVEFLYLTNAYHFYAPEPGPGSMIWFYVRFEGEDRPGTWYKMPLREDYPTAMEYTRRLSFCEGINQTIPPGVMPDAVLDARKYAGTREEIPLHPGIALAQQYRKPYPLSKQNLQSYARYIARTVKNPDDPERKVVSVKIYRVQHNILSAQELNHGIKPDSRTTYYPFFQGEFTPEGELINPNDPFLYWLIPILPRGAFDRSKQVIRPRSHEEEDEQVDDYVERHARLIGSSRPLLPQDLIPRIPGEDDPEPRKDH
jgi:hypothetical protein